MVKKRKKRPIKTSIREEKNFKPENNKAETPADVAFQRIKEMLYHHEIVPGQKLLYHELSKKLNMSSTPIIHALNKLQFLNIVYHKHNRGYYVGETNSREAEELFMAREAFEIYLIPSIVKNLTEGKLRVIQEAMEAHVNASSVPEYRRILMLKDTNFHLAIIKAGENKVIYNLCKFIFEQIYLKYRPEYMRNDRLRDAAKEHRMLLEALKEKDVKKIRRLTRQHIKNGKEHIVGSLLEDKSFEI